jgi:hypothetical protein
MATPADLVVLSGTAVACAAGRPVNRVNPVRSPNHVER